MQLLVQIQNMCSSLDDQRLGESGFNEVVKVVFSYLCALR